MDPQHSATSLTFTVYSRLNSNNFPVTKSWPERFSGNDPQETGPPKINWSGGDTNINASPNVCAFYAHLWYIVFSPTYEAHIVKQEHESCSTPIVIPCFSPLFFVFRSHIRNTLMTSHCRPEAQNTRTPKMPSKS